MRYRDVEQGVFRPAVEGCPRYGFILDGDLPPGLVGRSRIRRGRKYARGPHPPRPGDLGYTELAIFGP